MTDTWSKRGVSELRPSLSILDLLIMALGPCLAFKLVGELFLVTGRFRSELLERSMWRVRRDLGGEEVGSCCKAERSNVVGSNMSWGVVLM